MKGEASSGRSISEMVHDAGQHSLAEEAEDLIDAEAKQSEQSISIESFLVGLRSSGRMESMNSTICGGGD